MIRGANLRRRARRSVVRSKPMWGRTLVLLLALMLNGCAEDSSPPARTAEGGDPRRGRALYLSSCAACHSSDPSKDGPIGPAIKGSSQALIEARVLRATYPPGYTPKRKTSVMPAQPYLKSTLPDLAAFLRQP